MSADQIKGRIRLLFFSFRAGTLGGIGAGVFEILLLCRFGAAPANVSGLLFASVTYGILGGIIGIGLYIFLGLLPLRRDKKSSRHFLGVTISAAAFSAILFLIFLSRVFRDYHMDQVRYLEPLGLLTIAILLISALILFFVVRLILRRILPGVLNWVLKPIGYALSVPAFLIISLILSASLSEATAEIRAPFFAASQAGLEDKPCVILILVDTLRPDRLGCYGAGTVATPHIDTLAGDAVLFGQMYAQAPFTKPSVASLLSSRYPSEHRAIHESDALPEGVITLAEVLNSAGYYCGGVVTNINVAPIWNFQQGFHEYTYLPPKIFFGANEAASQLVIFRVLWVLRMKLVKSNYVDHFYYNAEAMTDYCEDFLHRNGNSKFFLFLHYMDPHDPYFEHPYSGKGYARMRSPNPDPRFAEPFKEFYRQEVEYLDHWIGRVLDKLKAEGLYDNSLIVFTSDHGEEFYEHGGWWHSQTLHEELVRVPLLIKTPGGQESGRVVESLTNSVDIAPTILSTMGLGCPAEMRGRDLFANPVQADFEPEVYSETDHAGNVARMLRIGPWKYIQTNPDNPRRRPPRQLFYMPDDPCEVHNLVGSQPAKAGEMQLLLEAKYQEALAARVESVEYGNGSGHAGTPQSSGIYTMSPILSGLSASKFSSMNPRAAEEGPF